jgi:HTH-type transcriptional regulator, global nitrogen regulator NrpRI
MNKTMLSILQVLDDSPDEALGSRDVSARLLNYGVNLTERTVRYHMMILDERGYSRSAGKQGRLITVKGSEELHNSEAASRLGFIINKIDTLSYEMSFDLASRSGMVIMNFTFVPRELLRQALDIMRPVFESRFCVCDRVLILQPGERAGSVKPPAGMVGIGTVCSITINGIFLKSGIPVASKFGGVLEVREGKPRRFTNLISYEGTSLDPLELFIKSRMTKAVGAIRHGGGSILGSFREIPAAALDKAKELDARMKQAGFDGILALGRPGTNLFEAPVGADRVGMVVVGGLNPIAVLEEEGIHAVNSAMSCLYEYKGLTKIKDAACHMA